MTKQSFDELMRNIEALTAKLENEQVSIEDSLTIFEQASVQITEAKRRLAELDHRFEVIAASFEESDTNPTGTEEE